MKRTLLTTLIISVLVCLQAQPANELDKLVKQVQQEETMRHGSLSVCVYNVSNGKHLYSHNAERSMVPASVEKLFTTGVGFARLGSEFRFTTKVAVRGDIDREGILHGNIYIIGGGDPLLDPSARGIHFFQ